MAQKPPGVSRLHCGRQDSSPAAAAQYWQTTGDSQAHSKVKMTSEQKAKEVLEA